MRGATLFLLSATLAALCVAAQDDAVLLRDVRALTFRRYEAARTGTTPKWPLTRAMTTARRGAPEPQLACAPSLAAASGPRATLRGRAELGMCAAYEPPSVQCVNQGQDDRGNVQWRCEAELDACVRFADSHVSCEGYASRDDARALRGSCALYYTLDWSADAGAACYEYAVARIPLPHGRNEYYGFVMGMFVALVAIGGMMVYLCCLSPEAETAVRAASLAPGDARASTAPARPPTTTTPKKTQPSSRASPGPAPAPPSIVQQVVNVHVDTTSQHVERTSHVYSRPGHPEAVVVAGTTSHALAYADTEMRAPSTPQHSDAGSSSSSTQASEAKPATTRPVVAFAGTEVRAPSVAVATARRSEACGGGGASPEAEVRRRSTAQAVATAYAGSSMR